MFWNRKEEKKKETSKISLVLKDNSPDFPYVLRLLDNLYKERKIGGGRLQLHLFWKKMHEIFPQTKEGCWELSSAESSYVKIISTDS